MTSTMKSGLRRAVAAVCCLALAGCGAIGNRSPAPASTPESPSDAPITAPSDPNAAMVFDVLAGEIAAQRGELETAYRYYLSAARRTGDAGAAERAARIAIYIKREDWAEQAVKYWTELAPGDVAARQAAAVIYARVGRLDQALAQLEELLRLENEKGDEGFLRVAAVLGTLNEVPLRLELMQRLVAGHTANAQAHYAYALVAVGAEQLDLAEAEARKALVLRRGWPKAQILLSRVLLAKGNNTGARGVLETALAGSADSLGLRAAYARLLVDTKDLNAAYDQFLRLHKLQPDNDEVLYALGVLALQLEQRDLAREHFRDLYGMNRRRDEAAFLIGQIEEKDKNLDAAREWYERVGGELEVEAQVRIARVLGEQGQLAQAQDLLQRLRVRLPEHAVTLYLVEGELLADADKQKVMELYAKALEAYPGDHKLLYARALVAAELGQVDVLERDLLMVLAENPEHADALNALGYTLADQTTRYQEALDYISRALELKPDSPAILDSMGWVQYRLGNYQEAVQYLQRANQLFPDAEIASHLGEVLWVMGNKKQARKVWEEALEREPDSRQLKEIMRRLR
jgi:tetratricopeptide (TPR) repeat protein